MGMNSEGIELANFINEVARRLELGGVAGCDPVKLLRNAADEIRRLAPVPTKRCAHCSETRPVTEFHKNSHTKDRLQAWCKPCMLAAEREHRQKKAARLKAVLATVKAASAANQQHLARLQARAKWAEVARQNAASA